MSIVTKSIKSNLLYYAIFVAIVQSENKIVTNLMQTQLETPDPEEMIIDFPGVILFLV